MCCVHITHSTHVFFPRLVSFFCSIQSMNGAQFYLEFISQLENASRVWFFSDGDDSNIIIKCCYTRFFPQLACVFWTKKTAGTLNVAMYRVSERTRANHLMQKSEFRKEKVWWQMFNRQFFNAFRCNGFHCILVNDLASKRWARSRH